jgi:hypothetical protein
MMHFFFAVSADTGRKELARVNRDEPKHRLNIQTEALLRQ